MARQATARVGRDQGKVSSGRTRDQAVSTEREIRLIRDPEERAIRAVGAHREAREAVLRLAQVRRDALIDLHEAGRTWQEVAATVGMSVKAVTKVTHAQTANGAWWKRLPDDIAESTKRGPGGLPLGEIIPKSELMQCLLRGMTTLDNTARKQGRGAARITPGQMAELCSARLGREISMPSLRNALYALIEEGTVLRVGHGRYVLTKKAATATKRAAPARKVTKELPPVQTRA